jgi:hypothetical protein
MSTTVPRTATEWAEHYSRRSGRPWPEDISVNESQQQRAAAASDGAGADIDDEPSGRDLLMERMMNGGKDPRAGKGTAGATDAEDVDDVDDAPSGRDLLMERMKGIKR